jgi:hypothetical protein
LFADALLLCLTDYGSAGLQMHPTVSSWGPSNRKTSISEHR